MSRALATRLLAMPDREDVVALYSRRSGELVIAMLACVRAGLTFAVLDANYPVERVELLLGVMRPGRLVVIGEAPAAVGSMMPLGSVLHLDRAAFDALEARPDDRLDAVRPDAVAYLLFTSGTTGAPKCIATKHTPLVHFVDWYERAFAVDPTRRFSMLSGLGHDPVLRDVFVPLSIGAQLHVPSQDVMLDPIKLHSWCFQHRITHAHVTPQLARILCAGRRDQPLPDLAFVCSGGDVLRRKLALDVIAVAPSVKVVNFYGSTETPQAMAAHVFDPLTDTSDTVPIGRGIDDVEIIVLALDNLAPVLANGSGQIAIRTRYLSEGYRDDPTLTDARFVPNPISSDVTDRLYLTGDIGHVRADGAVTLEGRVDDQVKVRGYRVELGDVAYHLNRLSQITEAVVLAERMPDGENRLVAYVIGTGDHEAARTAMCLAVPAYMVPARYVWLERFPLLPNGKIDRTGLRELEPVEQGAEEELDSTEAAIVADWKALLGRPGISADASFVSLGGDSLSFIQASVALEELLGGLPDGWEKLPIRDLAKVKRAEKSRWTRVDSSVLLRAISIIGVVLGHLEAPNLAGTTIALFVVSGMSFGRYVAPAIGQHGKLSPIFKLIAKVAIPVMIYTLIINLWSHLPTWPAMLLVSNLYTSDAHVIGIGFWYINTLVHCLLILAVLLAIPPVRRLLTRDDPFRVLIGATLLFIAVAYLAPLVFDTAHLADRVPQHYLRVIFLGWAAIYATTTRRKLLVLAIAIPAFADFVWFNDREYVWFPFLAIAFLLFTTRVSLPVWVGRIVTTVASASLFMYLIDKHVGLGVEKVGIDSWIVMAVAVVLLGILAWTAWEIATESLQRAVRRLRL